MTIICDQKLLSLLLMNKAELIEQLSATIGKTKVDKLSIILKESKFALADLIDITFHPDKTIAFRAAWLLENVYLQQPDKYLDDLNYLIKRLVEVKYPSCQRHYAKIVMHITSPKAPKSIQTELQKRNLEPVIEQLFEWMIDPQIKIAVKVFASEALFNMRGNYEWIEDELANQIHFLMRDGTMAIQTRGKKILKMLEK